MKKSVYYGGVLRTGFYNSTELLAYAAQYRPTPDELDYRGGVKYGEGKQQYLNLCTRKDLAANKKPLFIYVHGGGFISGITEMRNLYVSNWAKIGFFTASVSYTYAPKAVYPTQIGEVLSAVDFLFDHAEEYNIDTDNVVIAGESAGGYFITYLAAIASDPTLCDKLGIEFRHRDNFKVKAMVSHGGCYDLKRIFDKDNLQSKFPDIRPMICSFIGKTESETASWLSSEDGKYASPPVTADFPPTFVIWSQYDYLRYEAFDFMNQLDALGVPYAQFKGKGMVSMHAWTIATILKPAKECLNKAFDFVLPLLPEYFTQINGGFVFTQKG